MLPFGQGYPLGIPPANLFTQRVLIPNVPGVMATSAGAPALLQTPALAVPPHFTPIVVSQPPQQQQSQQQQPSPMMIGPGVLNDLPLPSGVPINGNDSPATAAAGGTSNAISQWSEHVNADGRIYYYNREKKISSWTKPDELKTTEEKEKGIWREYKTEEGKCYYYNTVTKTTTWNKPAALMTETELKSQQQPEEKMVRPIALVTAATANSDIERAMAATLKKFAASGDALNPVDEPKAHNTEAAKQRADAKASAGTAATAMAASSNESVTTDEDADTAKRRQIDKFKELIRDKYDNDRINTGMSWEQAMKFLQADSRFKVLPKVSEKKQVYNAWKVQRAKEERDEKRLAIKKAKEDLEKWLLAEPRMRSTLRYSKADALFAANGEWAAVSEAERREIFEDVQQLVKKRETKELQELRERNAKALADILDGIEEVNHRTTWAQAQRILIENPDFANDKILQGMDKEDALVVFQDHIRTAEELYVKEKQLEAKRVRRLERKVREAFVEFMQELNEHGILTSTSTWSALYPTISADARFENMLTQTGSTALDLFKFFVEELKNRYYKDRQVIRTILEDCEFIVTTSTTFEQLQERVRADERGKSVDAGNMKLCFNSLYDKAQVKEREREREQVRKQKRQESAFRDMLRALSPGVEPDSEWKAIRDRVKTADAFVGIENEDTRERYFEDYVKSLADGCGHYHAVAAASNADIIDASPPRKKSKKEKRKKSKKREERESGSETEPRPKKSKKRHRNESHDESSRSQKKSRHRSKSASTEAEEPLVPRDYSPAKEKEIITRYEDKIIGNGDADALSDVSSASDEEATK